MPSFTLFRRHSWFATRVDAYADGELPPSEAARLAAHLAACAHCRTAVEEAAALKTVLAALPEHAVPRSFRLTPAMLAQPRPVPALKATPLYLNLVRAGAGLSVAAFAAVFAYGALDSNDSGSDTSGAIQMSADTAAGGAEAAAPNKSATEAATPSLASASDPGASGSSIATPTMVSVAPLASPGALTSPDAPAERDRSAAERDEPGQESVAYAEDAAGAADDDDGLSALAIGLGAVAVASVLVLAALELRRRFHRA